MRKKLMLLVFTILIGEMCFAQQSHVNLDWAPQRNSEGLVPYGANTISPEVNDDHTVVFRIKAPDAKDVFLAGDLLRALKSTEAIPFVKGSEGIWSLTIGPLTPEIYY